MPTYEYVCTECQNLWEEVQKISEDPIKDCPKCGKAAAKRQISGGNFILKGGGWYADLYSSTKKSDGATSTNGSSSTSEGKSESAAPAAKTESSAPAAPSGSSGGSKT
jgi:putative FmdB family regulatory protein